MSEPEPIDLTAFDPAADPGRWAAVVGATRLRTAAVLRERELDPFNVLGDWARPILAAAAAVFLVLGASMAMFEPGAPRARTSEARRLAYLTESSSLRGRAPSGAELLSAIRARAAP